ncbi:hypothetical protein WH96_13045 [Kiloniella spongiae]|uniref:Uncharacterized protein n=1 Tax=Kiloniella spongiae TaxID=1489064 RepID=A0A0H2MCN7_9PROT|nr:hypothetical protein WH96_13045 [Kiloniella spongiae]
MVVANNSCNPSHISTSTTNKNNLRSTLNLLKNLFKSNKKRNIMTLKDIHDLPMHIKKDIGFWDVKPEDLSRHPINR